MKNVRLYFCTFLIFFLIPGKFFAFEPVSTCELLITYLENDNELKKNALEAQKAQLSFESSKISNGFNITLSTGNVSLYIDENGTDFSIKPSVKASIPQASNLSLSASTTFLTISSEPVFEDTSINLSVDIISSNGLSRRIALLKAERSLIEAKRKLQSQAIISEKSFYTELKSLLNQTSSIINSEKNLYTNKIDFEKIKTQGYSSGSSTYRLAQMKVVSAEHEIENSKRSLVHAYVVFYRKCGYVISIDENQDFYEFIPQDITEVLPLDIKSYKPETYSEIESALWTNKINTLQRKAKSFFSLSTNGGVTFSNSITDSTTIDAGLSTAVGGLNLSAGVSMPIDAKKNPAISFSASLAPNTYRQYSIEKKSDALAEQQELLAIETAHASFATKIIESEQSLEDLIWNNKSDNETYEMYASLEKDLSKWYKEGFVTESEYYSAKVNMQAYAVKKVMNSIDFIIYNDNILTMFVDDSQGKSEDE